MSVTDSGFYGGSNYGIPELNSFRGTAACSVRYNCLLYLVVMSIAVLSLLSCGQEQIVCGRSQ